MKTSVSTFTCGNFKFRFYQLAAVAISPNFYIFPPHRSHYFGWTEDCTKLNYKSFIDKFKCFCWFPKEKNKSEIIARICFFLCIFSKTKLYRFSSFNLFESRREKTSVWIKSIFQLSGFKITEHFSWLRKKIYWKNMKLPVEFDVIQVIKIN